MVPLGSVSIAVEPIGSASFTRPDSVVSKKAGDCVALKNNQWTQDKIHSVTASSQLAHLTRLQPKDIKDCAHA